MHISVFFYRNGRYFTKHFLYSECFAKSVCRKGCIKPLWASHTQRGLHTHIHTHSLVFFYYRYGTVLHKAPIQRGPYTYRRGFAKHLYRGGLHIQRGLHTHTYTHFGIFPTDIGVLHSPWWLCTYRVDTVHTCIHIYTHFCLFATDTGVLHKTSIQSWLCKPLYKGVLHIQKGFHTHTYTYFGLCLFRNGQHCIMSPYRALCTHIFHSFLLQIWWVLHKAYIQGRPCKAPRGFAHANRWESSTKSNFC